MSIFKKLLAICYLIFCTNVVAVEIKFFCTEHGYWYGRAFATFISGSDDDEISFSSATRYVNAVDENLSPQETLTFLLDQDSDASRKKLHLPKIAQNSFFGRDEASLQSDINLMESKLKNCRYLFEKIKHFWGVKKNVKYYVFCSRSLKHFVGLWLQNFEDAENVHVIALICAPNFEKISAFNYLAVVAHEFSHAMCDVAYGRENFDKLCEKFPSQNSIIAGWLMNEAITVALGNGLFYENLSGKKSDLAKEEEHCTKGFAQRIYPLVREYWAQEKSIDSQFLSRALAIFDEIFPDGYRRLDFNLYHTFAIHPDYVDDEKIGEAIMKKVMVSELQTKSFAQLMENDLLDAQKKHHAILIFFSNDDQLNNIKHLLPKYDVNQTINIVYSNKQIYAFVKINPKQDIEKYVNLLLKSK